MEIHHLDGQLQLLCRQRVPELEDGTELVTVHHSGTQKHGERIQIVQYGLLLRAGTQPRVVQRKAHAEVGAVRLIVCFKHLDPRNEHGGELDQQPLQATNGDSPFHHGEKDCVEPFCTTLD